MIFLLVSWHRRKPISDICFEAKRRACEIGYPILKLKRVLEAGGKGCELSRMKLNLKNRCSRAGELRLNLLLRCCSFIEEIHHFTQTILNTGARWSAWKCGPPFRTEFLFNVRHQKVIEWSSIGCRSRQEWVIANGWSCSRCAKVVIYYGAGTVEFIVTISWISIS